MKPTLLQDWITIRAVEASSSVSQSAHQYVDIGHHEDLVFYLDVKQVENSPSISYETAPALQDSLFLPMIAPIALAIGLRVDRVMFSTAAIPPARYVRWRLTHGIGTCTATFRIWLVAYDFSAARPRVA